MSESSSSSSDSDDVGDNDVDDCTTMLPCSVARCVKLDVYAIQRQHYKLK